MCYSYRQLSKDIQKHHLKTRVDEGLLRGLSVLAQGTRIFWVPGEPKYRQGTQRGCNFAFCLLHIEILWRDWEDLSVQPCVLEQISENTSLFEFRVMSYNILAQDLVEQGIDLYVHCHPDILSWNYRLPNLLQEIQHWDPDVSMTEPSLYQCYQNLNSLLDLTVLRKEKDGGKS